MVEFALASPWLVFLFVGAFDMGFYMHGLVSVQSAARVAASFTSTSASTAADSSGACAYALEELRAESNVGAGVTTCAAAPVVVTATAITGPDGSPATRVRVTYTTPPLVPIPGLIAGQMTISREARMRVRQ